MSKITYFIGTDHAGYKLKAFVIAFLQERGFKVVDLAPQSENRVDYPDFAQKVCEAIDLESSRGIL
ncbi:RpiB/LacA/LacB family sugar-phosphate isomerase, partial [Helicobacter typhlonius]